MSIPEIMVSALYDKKIGCASENFFLRVKRDKAECSPLWQKQLGSSAKSANKKP